MDWNIIISILSGLAVCIPLVLQLVKYVKESVQNKAWDKLLKLILADMANAEEMFEKGAERKEYVMGQILTNASTVGYTLGADDIQKLSDLIDSLCDMAKIVNAEKAAADE